MNIRKLWIVVLLQFGAMAAQAQIDPLTMQYFNNRYQLNPAFAGLEAGSRLNAGFRTQMSGVPGGPVSQALTYDYGFDKVGLGLNIFNDKAGLQRQTRVAASFAYHVTLAEDQKLNFGVSAGIMNERLSIGDIQGDPNDVLAGQYNDRDTHLDGDFGVAYTNTRLTIHAAVPNVRNFFKEENIRFADVARFYSAVSYRIPLNGARESLVEPLVAYRILQEQDDIWDAGAQLELLDRQLLFTGLYHSSESATFGVGMDYRLKYLVTASYTINTSALRNYSHGNFEINLRLKF
ncbi:hypothetical protein C7T94_18955 [Pedobacter yulinensis]|uniref:Type IX secretion system membrane protein PorP/SprF n=1 Tax=Pedobacter yulinensis TaxID=2126353 RepID=A0A2T3HGJ7_9SPHI|nr:PorP/SprF family type IX secretion system membrane protein [Pedobacter yulinensis]PST81552.1 hypothetical protein C7T94_18955 [Pedobacter yulinensis]